MLDNAELLTGQQGKTLDEMCRKYNDTSIQISDLTVTKKHAGEEIKKLCNAKGTWESMNYVVTISKIEDKISLDTEKVENYLKENYPNIWEEIEKNCMKKSKGYLKIGTVKPKTNI